MRRRSTTTSEADRLERLWAGNFGHRYAIRNADAGNRRGEFWAFLLGTYPVESVLEVGCNVGANLRWLVDLVHPKNLFALDVSAEAIATVRRRFPAVNAEVGRARSLPYPDRAFDLAFTTGVLIHQPDESLLDVMREIVRVSRRYVLAGEYFSPDPVEVPYRDQSGALFKRDYGRMYLDTFPDLHLVASGELGPDEGWDDVRWWLLERSHVGA